MKKQVIQQKGTFLDRQILSAFTVLAKNKLQQSLSNSQLSG
jgi:hypothetical protein